jgi:hypothetical protein
VTERDKRVYFLSCTNSEEIGRTLLLHLRVVGPDAP